MRSHLLACASLLFVVSALLSAESPLSSDPSSTNVGSATIILGSTPETYGVASKTFLTLTPWDFVPISSTVTYEVNNTAVGQMIARTGGPNFFKAPIHLPSGALVTEVEFVFCDITAAAGFASFLFTQPRLGLSTNVTLVTTSAADTPGCVALTAVLGTPVQIDNGANSYQIEINMGGVNDILIGSARVGYHLQVSPSPAVATFPGDVPTSHVFFRYIEALASAGITGGCGAGVYCPDAPVTRGQMAVFLSIALGLHFPN